MTAKTSPARRAAFMAAVAETGNRTLAAERAKVSQSWVTLHRATDPEFLAELDAAVASAKARLRAEAATAKPAAGWGTAGGEELVVRGTNGRRVQIARARLKQWTSRVEARFLAALAGCCNVKAACAEVGLTPASAYNHRQRWPRFAERWDEALTLGYDRVEAALVANADRALGDTDFVPEIEMPPASFNDAIRLLRIHRLHVLGVGKAPGASRRPKSLDDPEIRASILRKFEAIEGMRQRLAADDSAGDARAIAAGVRIVARKRPAG